MQQLFDKFTHGQARLILIALGLLLILAGSCLLYAAYLSGGRLYFRVGGAVGTSGVIVIALELTGMRRVLRMGFGFAVMGLGLFMMIPGVPGPGFVFVLIALGILAIDLKWARELSHRLNVLYHKTLDKMKSRREETKGGD